MKEKDIAKWALPWCCLRYYEIFLSYFIRPTSPFQGIAMTRELMGLFSWHEALELRSLTIIDPPKSTCRCRFCGMEWERRNIMK